ncbi:unnamed protein product, partial [Protopolystoma xenopodis]
MASCVYLTRQHTRTHSRGGCASGMCPRNCPCWTARRVVNAISRNGPALSLREADQPARVVVDVDDANRLLHTRHTPTHSGLFCVSPTAHLRVYPSPHGCHEMGCFVFAARFGFEGRAGDDLFAQPNNIIPSSPAPPIRRHGVKPTYEPEGSLQKPPSFYTCLLVCPFLVLLSVCVGLTSLGTGVRVEARRTRPHRRLSPRLRLRLRL